MKKASLDFWCKQSVLRLLRLTALPLIAAIFSSGCASISPLPVAVQDLGPNYKPTNVYRQSNTIPPQIRRVAILPLTTTSSTAFLDAGVDVLEPLVYAELEKAKRFEVIPVTVQQLKQLTGRIGWRSDEQLPPNLFQRVSDATGCDAVLFCQLTRYAPYQPLAVGWKFTLVENLNAGAGPGQPWQPQILWSADEVLDAGDPSVATGARAYYAQHLRIDAPSSDPSTVLSSPARFGQYTLATLLATLPERAGSKH